MINKEILAQKRKRILMYFETLSSYGLSVDVALEFMSYVFSLTERYMLMEILSRCDIKDFETVTLDHWDLDKKMIEVFVRKQFRAGK